MLRHLIGIIAGAAFALAPAASMAVTNVVPGAVTTLADPHLFTHPSGDNHVHGVVNDPNGDIFVGDWNASHTGNSPCMGTLVTNQDSIRRITPLGQVSTLASIASPNGMTYDARDRTLYVVTGSLACEAGIYRTAGPGFHGVVAIDVDSGKQTAVAGGKAGFANGVGADARFTEPYDIAYDPDNGTLYIADGYHNRIRQLDPKTAAVAAFAGSGEKGNADGTGAAASFNYSQGIAYCAADKSLYVADTDNNEIRKISPEAVVTTVAGATEAGFVDGPASTARFDHPTGLTCDRSGNLYVADSRNNAIREISTMGMVSTLAGAKTAGTVDGVGTAARFSTPADITYDPVTNSLYVLDFATNTIRNVALGSQ